MSIYQMIIPDRIKAEGCSTDKSGHLKSVTNICPLKLLLKNTYDIVTTKKICNLEMIPVPKLKVPMGLTTFNCSLHYFLCD